MDHADLSASPTPSNTAVDNSRSNHHESDPFATGPKQTRKPSAAPAEPNTLQPTPTYNPTALLNPRAASRSQARPTSDTPAEAEDGSSGTAQMIERLHGVTERDSVPQKKRKVQAVETDESDEERKKQTHTFNKKVGSGGVISDNLQAARKQDASQVTSIDLTGIDDDDDIQVTKDSQNEEVCLGATSANINVHRIPNFPSSSFRSLGKDQWPSIRVGFRKEGGENKIINVLDSTGAKFGQMEARVAAALCMIMQGEAINKVHFRIRLASRPKRDGEVPGKPVSMNWACGVTVYAPRRKADSVGRFLSRMQIYLTRPYENPGKEYENPQNPKIFGPPRTGARPQTSQSTPHVSRTIEEMRREASNMFDDLAKSADSMPEMEAEPTTITTPLMPHQKQALHFMIEHEQTDSNNRKNKGELSLWKLQPKDNGQPAWYHVITGQQVTEMPNPAQGGILADVMGLGKTLSILSLVAGSREESKRFRASGVPDDIDESVVCNSRATLIICPKSVMANWQEQIGMHTAAGKVSSYAYHGSSRTSDAYMLSKHDVVITTYNTLAAEYVDSQRKQSPLASVNWFRVVLDEAHAIRTQTSKMFQACRALYASRRWAVTGTPIQNGLDDLGALVKFLHIKPFDNDKVWSQYITSPLKNGDADAVQHLQILVGSISLRRLKDTVDLLQRTERTVRLQFSKTEWELYKQYARKCGSQLRIMTKRGDDRLRGRAYAHVLKAIGRLRAICAHGREMLSEDDMKDVEGSDDGNVITLDLGEEPGDENRDDFITQKQAYETFQTMVDSDVARCNECERLLVPTNPFKPNEIIDLTGEDSDEEPSTDSAGDTDEAHDHNLFGYLTPCYHPLCSDCKDEFLKKIGDDLSIDGYYVCPNCEQHVRLGFFPLLRSGFKQYQEAREGSSRRPQNGKWDENTYSGPHSKVRALIEDLKKSDEETDDLPEDEPPIRSVVFSGWTSYLDLIEYALQREGFGFLRLDGSMSVKARREVLEQFKTDPEKTVLLVSIKAGGQGLNLTAASKVYVMEPQFNPGVEQQAVDRVHRMGQTRDVTITHYIMKGLEPGYETVEEAIVQLQEQKDMLAKMATDRNRSKAEESREKLEKLKKLFK